MATDEEGNIIDFTGIRLLPRQRSSDPKQPYPDSHFDNDGSPPLTYSTEATATDKAQAAGLVETQVEDLVKPIQAVTPAYVHIVHHITHTMEEGAQDYATETFILAAKVPARVLARDPNRRKATILNSGSNSCVVGKLAQVEYGNGFPLVAGAAEDWHSVPDVWAYSTDGTTIDVKIERNRYNNNDAARNAVGKAHSGANLSVGDSTTLNRALNGS